jgi:hypothetical protein
MAKSKALKKSAKKVAAKKVVAKKGPVKKAIPAKKPGAKKAPTKKIVAKKIVTKKPVAKKASVLKATAKKSSSKKVVSTKKTIAKKAPAKKPTVTAAPVKPVKKEIKSKILSKEEAIKKYKTTHSAPAIKTKPKGKPAVSKNYDEEDDEFNLDVDLLDEDETVDAAMGDENFEDDEDDDGKEGDPRFAGEEFDPEDDEVKTEGSYSYGWGYNDAFDKPEDVEQNHDLDEDEEYALGKKSKPGEEDALDDEDDY